MTIPRASVALALGSAVSLAAQALFSLLMLRAFSPEAVGGFAVIAQLAFFWMTLALAQSPLRLLADANVPLAQARRQALQGTGVRLLVLLPVACLAAFLAGAPLVTSMGWAALLALLQAGWYIAQPFALRSSQPASAAAARALPPLCALAAAAVGAWWMPGAGAAVLLASAAVGYAAGCLWLFQPGADLAAPADSRPLPEQGDSRSTLLRLVHTAADAATGAALLLVWQRAHGTAEAGLLAVLLRLLGMMPVVVHTAWAQVLLAQGRRWHASPLWAAGAGAGMTAALGAAFAMLLAQGWLPEWQAALPYVLPIALWQAAACMHAACSHLPFQHGRASAFSYAAIGFAAVQWLALSLPAVAGATAQAHAWWLSATSAAGLLVWTTAIVRSCRTPAFAPDAQAPRRET